MSVLAQTSTTGKPDYNAIAGFYPKHWRAHYHTGLLATVGRLLLPRLRPGARILDVCCGTGTLAQELVSQGFRVTGMDASEQMLRYAFREVPEAEFLVADAREFAFPALFDAALGTFDTLSYMHTAEDLERVFSRVHAALRPGGLFTFDLSLEEAYRSEWLIEGDEACFVRGSDDESNRSGRTLITTFNRNVKWERTDVVFQARCHRPEEIGSALQRSGFTETVCHRSDEDEELRQDFGPGRACFLARK